MTMTQRELVALYSAVTDCAGGGCPHCTQLLRCARGMITPGERAEPVSLELYCPECNGRHIDQDGWETTEYAHKTHLCAHCGHEWRPFPYATVGT